MEWKDEFKDWVYRFRIETAMNRDVVQLKCVRNKWDEEHGWINEQLTTEGWEPYEDGWELRPNVPEMNGRHMALDKAARQELLAEIKVLLEASGAEDIRVDA